MAYGKRSPSAPKGSKKGMIGQASKPKSIETTNAERYDMNRVQNRPMCRKGYDMEAWSYEY